jgi:hypothetical protein
MGTVAQIPCSLIQLVAYVMVTGHEFIANGGTPPSAAIRIGKIRQQSTGGETANCTSHHYE